MMKTIEGRILKMETHLADSAAHFHLPFGQDRVEMNSLVGKKIAFHFTGEINDIITGEKIRKSYNSGYSYKNFMSLAQCDLCIVRPELCHYHEGTCREPRWGEKYCFVNHIVYLSLTDNLKIGITKASNIPYRWIDQGAVKALPLVQVKDRYTSGLIESELAKKYRDKTHWKKMLADKRENDDIDLPSFREQIFDNYCDLFDDMDAQDLDEDVVEIVYPIKRIPKSITSLSFDKQQSFEGELLGIKGQYLLFEEAVINIRRHQGYCLKMDYE